MFKLTKFSGDELLVNPDTLKYVEGGGDTIVYLTTGDRILVKEAPETIKELFTDYKKEITQIPVEITRGD